MSQPDADYRHFFCMSCGAKLKAKAEKAGKKLPCPKCSAVLVIPGTSVISQTPDTGIAACIKVGTYALREAEKEARPIIAQGEHSGPVLPIPGNTTVANCQTESYAISDISATQDSDAVGEGTAAAYEGRTQRVLIHKPLVRPTPPQWPLVQGVLVFLLEPGAIVYWSVLSFISVLWLPLLAVAMDSGNANAYEDGIANAYTCGIVVLSGMFVAVPSSACFMTILQESAAGNRIIEEWPWFAFRDYFLESFYIINSVLTSVVAAWLLTYPLTGFENARAFFYVFCFVILFPIVLLSMLEAGSCLVPVSLVVYQGLRRSWRTWLVFYVESLVFVYGLLVYLGVLEFLWQHYSEHIAFGNGSMVMAMGSVLMLLIYILAIALTLMAIVAAPVVLLEMIYFRLLGRLAWVCDEDARKQLAEEEDEEDETENAEASEIRPVPVDVF